MSEEQRVDIEARVLSVRPLPYGGYGVMLGPPPELFYIVTETPLQVGAMARVRGVAIGVRGLAGNATLTQVVSEEVSEVSASTGRFVHDEWLERVDLVMRSPLYDYQRVGAAWIASRLARGKGSILADDMGLGKTRQIIAAALAAQVTPMIVVCPMTLKHEWKNELQQSSMPLEVQMLDGAHGYVYEAHVWLVHYDILKQRERQLHKMQAKLVVFDEGHLLKEPRPAYDHRAAVATRLAHAIGLAIIATGTPLLNAAEEYWRLLHTVDPDAWPSFEEYAERYCHLPTEDELREDPTAQKRIVTSQGRVERSEELQSRVDEVLLRRTKEEALLEMPDKIPEKTRRVIDVDLDPEDREEYERARKDVAAWYIAQGESLRASRVKQAQGLMRLTTLRQIATMAKMRRAVPEYLAAWFGRELIEPLVVFGYHRKPLERLAEIAQMLKIRTGIIQGADSTAASRSAVVEAFRAGEIDMLAAPIQIAGIGLNLQNASRALFLEWTWRPADMEQAEARLHRIGQLRPVGIDYLAAKDTIDRHMKQVIEGKQVLIDALVDGASCGDLVAE